MENFLFVWVCSNCGHIHSGVASTSDSEFVAKRDHFIEDCTSKNEEYRIMPLDLQENAELIKSRQGREESEDNFIDSLLSSLMMGNSEN